MTVHNKMSAKDDTSFFKRGYEKTTQLTESEGQSTVSLAFHIINLLTLEVELLLFSSQKLGPIECILLEVRHCDSR